MAHAKHEERVACRPYRCWDWNFETFKATCERGAPARVKQPSSRSTRKSLIFGRNEIHMLNDDRGEAALAFFELNAELSIDGFGERNGTILECFRGFG